MKFENIHVYNFRDALRGMRNPKNSWDRSDSEWGICYESGRNNILDNMIKLYHASELPLTNEKVIDQWRKDYAHDVFIDKNEINGAYLYQIIGPNDMKLAQTLIQAGPEHRKFLRQIMVSVDITAPLYFFKEFDTYRVGVTANSTSTMHKLTSKPITLDCFEIDDYNSEVMNEIETGLNESATKTIINICESLRQKYLETKDKKYWKELVRWLPEGWLQTRTVTMSYENLINIYHQRKNHKLNEWSGTDDPNNDNFIHFIRQLPYASDLILLES